MPKYYDSYSSNEDLSLENSFQDKNAHYYFSPERAALINSNSQYGYNPYEASYDAVLNELQDTFYQKAYDEVLDELEQSFSSENSEEWSDRDIHEYYFEPVLYDIETYHERKALDQERGALLVDLQGYQQLAKDLEGAYKSEKARRFNQGYMPSLFRNAEPAQHRLDAILKIQASVKAVEDNLEKLEIYPEYFDSEDQLMAMKYQIHHLQQAILAIKGAALNEYNQINDSYMLRDPKNSALHTVLQKNFNCEKMEPEVKSQAEDAFKMLNKRIEMENRLEAEAAKDKPTAFVI